MIFMRPWGRADASDLVRIVDSTPDLSTQFNTEAICDEAAAQQFIAESMVFTDSHRCWALVARSEVVGAVGLASLERRHLTAWAYYWLERSARGNGYATAALNAASDWAFTQAGLFRLELGHRVNNPASCRVAIRAGFGAEGIEREKLEYGGKRFDVERHARLATDPTPIAASNDQVTINVSLSEL